MANHEQQPVLPLHWKINGHTWSFIGKQSVSFILGAALAIFAFGTKSQQFADLLIWKGQTDALVKTNSDAITTNKFAIQSAREEQARFDTRLKIVEDSARKIDTMLLKIEGLEKKMDDSSRKP